LNYGHRDVGSPTLQWAKCLYHISENEESYATAAPKSLPLGNMDSGERKHQQSVCTSDDHSRQNIPKKGNKQIQN